MDFFLLSFVVVNVSRLGFGNISLVLGFHCKNNSDGIYPVTVFGVSIRE